MKGTELRIGNYVNYVSEKVIVLQTSIEGRNDWDVELGYFEDSIGFERKINEITPIPITEEWLLKFGFENNSLKANHNTIIYYSENNIGIKGMLGVIKPKECKYVHQLQNLYFALTGEELKLKQ